MLIFFIYRPSTGKYIIVIGVIDLKCICNSEQWWFIAIGDNVCCHAIML